MKILKTKLLSAFLVSLCLLMTTAATANERYGKQKVVYHINYDNPKQQTGALRNVQNHINAVGAENLDIKIVLHGNGLALLLEPDSLKKLKKFKHANAAVLKVRVSISMYALIPFAAVKWI